MPPTRASTSKAPPGRSRGPAEELRYRLTEALAASNAELAHGDELLIEQQLATVESWRQAARAAVLGERTSPQASDMTASASNSAWPSSRTLRTWCAAWSRSIVGTTACPDERSSTTRDGSAAPPRRVPRTPDTTNPTTPSTGSAGVLCPNRWTSSDARPGRSDAGAVQPAGPPRRAPRRTQSARGHGLPTRRRRTRDAARIVDVEPELAAKSTTRKQTYVKLVQETRDLGGVLGKPDAAGDGAIASGRAETLDRDPLTDTGQLRRLDRLFSHIDERVCEAVEHGIKERLYFLRVPFPRVDDRSPGVVKGPRHRYLPITSPVQTDLLAIVRQDLRPAPIKPTAPKGAAQIRIDFEAALRRRPGDSGPSVAM